MALHWNMEDVEDFEEISEGFDWQITEAMIYGTMTIGINKITEANYQEVFVRLKMSEAIVGTPFIRWTDEGKEEIGWSLEMVKRRIGLGTNASPMSKAKFNGMLTRRMRENAERLARSEETV